MRHALPVLSKIGRQLALLALLLVFGLAGTPEAWAQGGASDLVVAPTRVVFEGRTRSLTVSLLNNGNETAKYRISIINMRMTETGQFERLEKDTPPLVGERFAEGMFRYAPRQVELAAGQSQAIRLLLRKPPDLAAGEYRSHLLIQKIPKQGTGRSVEAVPGAGGISVSLVVIPGVALPIIIRHGELSVAANLSDMHMIRTGVNNERPGVAFRINRTGNRSVFGDLTATYYPPGGIEGIVVARINKLAVYSPNTTRSVAMALTVPENVSLAPGGRLAVSFRTPPQEGDELIAEGSLKLP